MPVPAILPNTSALQSLLATPKKVVITTHLNPDGDAVGSSLGLAHYLQQLEHLTTVVIPNDDPKFLHWLPGHADILNYEQQNEVVIQSMENAEVIFSLDYNALDRVKEMGALIRKSEATKVLIDHHLEPEDFAHITLHTTAASSTAELIYEMISQLQLPATVNTDIATCLYAGILTDTGSFQYASTTPRVHEIVADLMTTGIDTFEIYDKIYNAASITRLRFFGHCWAHKMFVNAKVGYAIIDVTVQEQLRFHLQKGDTEGLVNTPLQIEGIRVSVLATEQEGYVKLSFRSKGDIDMNTLARQHFEGGGHKNAAGGIQHLPLDKVIEKIKQTVPKHMKGGQS